MLHVNISRVIEAAAMGIHHPAPTRQRMENLSPIVLKLSLHPTTNYSSTVITMLCHYQ